MEYRSAFIGIPLPKEYLEEFIALTEAVKGIVPDIRVVDLATPHITVFFLGDQNKKSLQAVASYIEQQKATLSGTITVGKGGHFGGNKPRVLYLEAESEALKDFYEKTFEEFAKYRQPDMWEFQLHLTIGRMKGAATKEYLSNKQSVQELLNKKWRFPIKEIAVYGIDKTVQPNRQQKLYPIYL